MTKTGSTSRTTLTTLKAHPQCTIMLRPPISVSAFITSVIEINRTTSRETVRVGVRCAMNATLTFESTNMTGRTVGLVLGVKTCMVTRVVVKVVKRLTGMVSALKETVVFVARMHTVHSRTMGNVEVTSKSSLAPW